MAYADMQINCRRFDTAGHGARKIVKRFSRPAEAEITQAYMITDYSAGFISVGGEFENFWNMSKASLFLPVFWQQIPS